MKIKSLILLIACASIGFGAIPNAVAAIIPLGCTETKIGNISAPGERDSFSVSVVAGERFIIRVSETSSSLYPKIRVLKPGGGEQIAQGPSLAKADFLSGTETGTYLIEMQDYYTSGAGGYAISVQFLRTDCVEALSGCSPQVQVNFTQASQMKTYAIQVNAADRFLLRMVETSGSIYPEVRVIKPSGGEVSYSDPSKVELDFLNGNETGTYYILVEDYYGYEIGSGMLGVQYLRADCAEPLANCSAFVQVNFVQASQMKTYSLQVNAADRFLLRMAESSGSIYPQVRVFKPSGVEIKGSSPSKVELDFLSGNESGTYYIVVQDYYGTGIGSGGLDLQFLRTDCADSLTGCAPIVQVNFVQPGQMKAFAVHVGAADRFLLRMIETAGSIYPDVRVFKPSGVEQRSSDPSKVELDFLTGNETGTYYIVVQDYYGTGIGTGALSLQFLNTLCAESLSNCSPLVQVNFVQAAQMKAYVVQVDAADRFLLRMNEVAGSAYPQVRVFKPSGVEISNSNPSKVDLDLLNGNETGAYFIVLQDYYGTGTGTGALGLQFLRTDCAEALTGCAPIVQANLSQPGLMKTYSVQVNAADRFVLRVIETSGSIYPEVRVFKPSGVEIHKSDPSKTEFDFFTGNETGTYFIAIKDFNGTGTGSAACALQFLSTNCSTNIDCGAALNGALSQSAQMQAYHFFVKKDSAFQVLLSGSVLYHHLRIIAPNNVVWGPTGYNSITQSVPAAPVSGEYYIIVQDYYGTKTGSFVLSLTGCTTITNPCFEPIVEWLDFQPGSVCAGTKIKPGLKNADPNFDFVLLKDGQPTTSTLSGAGLDAFFFPEITIAAPAEFTVKAVAKSTASCAFDFPDPVYAVSIGQLSLNVTVKNESAFDVNGYIGICAPGGIAPFILDYSPQRGVLFNPSSNCFDIDSLRAGLYALRITDASGCKADTIVEVSNPEKRRIGFPEKPFLSPNGDGKNDRLIFDGLLRYPDANELIIFNRYGSLLFQAKPYLNDWDATYSGQALPNDTYFYKLLVTETGEATTYTGFITVLR